MEKRLVHRQDHEVRVVRALTKSDLRELGGRLGPDGFLWWDPKGALSDDEVVEIQVTNVRLSRPLLLLDHLLPPADAETVIGDLLEAMGRGGVVNQRGAIWLWAQVVRILIDRSIDLLRRVRMAWRAGG